MLYTHSSMGKCSIKTDSVIIDSHQKIVIDFPAPYLYGSSIIGKDTVYQGILHQWLERQHRKEEVKGLCIMLHFYLSRPDIAFQSKEGICMLQLLLKGHRFIFSHRVKIHSEIGCKA